MFKKYLNYIKKALNSSKYDYITYCNLPIEENYVLIEGGQGANINGNMFHMLREICENPRWQSYTPIVVVTNKTQEKANARSEFYGFKNVVFTVRDSKSYLKYLATAKYLLTDNTFPPYFNKRQGQVYLNTWHGTPLKKLGKANKQDLKSLANVQKNYLMSDYALFPNEFTRNVFMRDYNLATLFKNKSFIANYPRNSVFYNSQAGEDLKEKLGYKGKSVYAYMPTWRDGDTPAQKKQQINKTTEILNEFDEKLNEDTVLLVNLHFLLSSEIDCAKYKHIEYFSPDYETYDILNACDGLITDYSSVFFDFAVSKKKIILFAYDKAEYLKNRGIYIDFDNLPFPIAEDVDTVIKLMGGNNTVSDSFINEYCANGSVNSCEDVFSLMVEGESEKYSITQHKAKENICLLYAGTLQSKCYRAISAYIKNNPDFNYVITYRRALKPENKQLLENIVGETAIYGTLTAYQYLKSEAIKILSALVFKTFKNKKLKSFFERERCRLFPTIEPQRVVDFTSNSTCFTGVLAAFNCEKQSVLHSRFYSGKKSKGSLRLQGDFGFIKYDNREAEENEVLSILNPTEKAAAISEFFNVNNKLPVYFNMGNKLRMVSLYKASTPIKVNTDDLYVTVAGVKYLPKFIGIRKNSYIHKGVLSLAIPVEDVILNSNQSDVSLNFNYEGERVTRRFKYFSPIGNLFLGLRGPMNVHKKSNTIALFRQTEKENLLMIYVRAVNITDSFKERFKQLIAFCVSLVWKTKKAKSIVLLYEKNSSKYEESASIVYEKLIDKGYDNAYFILDKNYEYYNKIPEKYCKNIIHKYTFKHYLYYFTSKTFIGTEALPHAFDLKTCNILPLYKTIRKDLRYVFLQHGVMYMVSLDSESRNMFKRKNLAKYRVVVSSEAEKKHFTTLGRHLDEDIYVCGLPKYDKNTLNADADKIVIMPTWRPWEINIARSEFSQSPYYKMLMKIYNNVPGDLKNNVVILPHPLIVNELTKASPEVTNKLLLNARYDDVLKTARLLITDYSSIAFDSFYRGSNVIFYWEEKDYCMAQYGPSTKLMLNEDNVYGDYFYSEKGLSEAILRNYNNPQTEEYKKRYSHLVDFHDGKNTERLIEFLKKDRII